MNGRRLLIVRVGAMGDVLHALPAVAALREARPGLEIGWAVDSRWAPLLVGDSEAGPLVSRIHRADTRLWSHAPVSRATFRSVAELRAELVSSRYERAVDMQGTLRSAVIARLADAEDVSGYADPREAVARVLYTRTLERRGEHVVDQGAALLGEAVGLRLQPATAELPRCAEAEQWADQRMARSCFERPLALLAPSAGWGAKQWPAERFGELSRVLAAMGFAVLVNAASAEDPVSAAVVRSSMATAAAVACSVAELVALTRRASVVVGGDSGPVHLAAALGRPVVALYGPTDPLRNGPWGPGAKVVLRDPASITSHKRVAQVEAGLARIAVADVVSAVEAVLAEAPALRQ